MVNNHFDLTRETFFVMTMSILASELILSVDLTTFKPVFKNQYVHPNTIKQDNFGQFLT